MCEILTDQNFEEVVTKNDQPVLVDFWAPRCEHCLRLAPVIDQLDENYKGRVTVGKINADEFPVLSRKCEVMGLPTILIFHHGELVERLICGRPYDEYAGLLDQILEK